MPIEDFKQVIVSNCDVPTCILRHGTTATIKIKIVPPKTIQKLVGRMSVLFFNIPIPLIGFDGTNACDNIYKNGIKVGCPLLKDIEYIYENSIDILPSFPQVILQIYLYNFLYVPCNIENI